MFSIESVKFGVFADSRTRKAYKKISLLLDPSFLDLCLIHVGEVSKKVDEVCVGEVRILHHKSLRTLYLLLITREF